MRGTMPTPVSIVKTFFKEKTFRSKKYLEFIRSQPCLICQHPESDPHHETLSGKGTGLKGPDNETIPLCKTHHDERHRVGRETFYNKHGFRWRLWVYFYQYRYEEIHGKIK